MFDPIKIAFYIFSGLLLTMSMLPLLNKKVWWIRVFDFIHAQLFLLVILVLTINFLFIKNNEPTDYLLMGLLTCLLIYHAYKIYPYTWLQKKEVHAASFTNGNQISLIAFNVFIDNKEIEALIKLIKQYRPDILLLVETNQWWLDQLEELKNDYPYFIGRPLENAYGIALFSKVKLINPEIMYLIEDDIPSIRTMVKVNDDLQFELRGLHPRPPSPTQNETSIERDAELLLVAEEIEDVKHPVIVAGDLNDVAWSPTSLLFRKISGLLDPRIGRGFYNTFSANLPFFRYPLDHIFHSHHFKIRKIERLPDIGSDHFPMYISLQYDPDAKYEQSAQEKSTEDEVAASKIIKRGIAAGKNR